MLASGYDYTPVVKQYRTRSIELIVCTRGHPNESLDWDWDNKLSVASLFFDFNQIESPHKKIKIMFTSIHSQAHHFIISLGTLKLSKLFFLIIHVEITFIFIDWLFGLWYFTPLSTILQLYRCGQFYWGRKPEYPEKTINLPQVTDKPFYIMLYRAHLTWAGFEVTTLVVIGTDCTDSCKSNYHAITAAYHSYRRR